MENVRRTNNSNQRKESELVQGWFNGGKRVDYDPVNHSFISSSNSLKVFLRGEGDLTRAATFMPGYPDGSFGWSKVLPYLSGSDEMPKLFIEYVGMGDSDKPKNYVYSTAERADLVEAAWRKMAVKSTTLIAFDFSSLVILEILQRRLERAQRGELESGPQICGVFIFNGGLFIDGHSHPWYTTPILRRLSDKASEKVGGSFKRFKMIMKMTMWSRGYHVSDAEIQSLYDTMNRHDGLFYLAKAAGFVVDQKSQGMRLDFGRIFEAYHDQFPFLIGGSDKDPFEHRQVRLTEKRLGGKANLQVKHLPGGHLTTDEHPKELAALITEFQESVA